ncbi:GDP-mannose pyrophosphorylase [Trypanosoma grayi]|uniref:GDP-mannose pyrophosphorylase n=1 Tax=Trypanosoma grayi TaxID=71804 RepID=UPI0004F4BB51|nr:GDP-mannose pyrophosphorylase [Trypanosoma grayi]KEG10107.1 GDP-mannose pyrophosphorylase [Trypanosoma grayi]
MQAHATVAHPSVAVSLLFDVVVFAGGTAPGLSPLCDNEPKPMLCICNRPMIWYCLYPWIAAGCRTFYLCVNEDYAALQSYLCREFPSVAFVFVLIPLTQNETPSTTCDVVKAYLKHKDSLKPDKLGQPRDALLLSCDTLLPGLNVEHFIRNFYCSVAAVSVLLFRPLASTRTASSLATSPMNGPKSSKGQGGAPSVKPYTYRYTCTAYEEEGTEETADGGDVQGLKSGESDSAAGNGTNVHHHRLHFICPYEDSPAPRISLGFTARRPNLTFAADTIDAHAYLVRHWVMHHIAESAGEGMTLQRDCIPFLARSQHSTVNAELDVFLRPDSKIKFSIPKHWLFEGDSSVQTLNACPGSVLPAEADNLLVCCSIYEERENEAMRVYRVRTREDFLAVNHEILAAKSDLLELGETAANVPGTQHQHPHQQQQRKSSGKKGMEAIVGPVLPPAGALTLSYLLPDSPFNLQAKKGSQQVQIKSSFLRSVPTGSSFITRSIIGSNVTLGANVRITNSVILDNAEIGANAVITNSIIGSSAMVNPGVRVVSSTVGPQCLVEADVTDSVART